MTSHVEAGSAQNDARTGEQIDTRLTRARSSSDHVKDAACALSDLNIFYAIIALAEGGLLHAPSCNGAARIIKICQREGQRCLEAYDRARAKAKCP